MRSSVIHCSAISSAGSRRLPVSPRTGTISANIAHRDRTSNEVALLVSGSYFPVLGLRPALGRLLTSDDDRTPGAHSVVVLSHAYWRSRFGEDPSILNDTIVINGLPMTVVGVAPRGFEGTTVEELPRVFLPIMMSGGDSFRLRRARQTGAITGSICSHGSSRACRAKRRRPPSTVSSAESCRTPSSHCSRTLFAATGSAPTFSLEKFFSPMAPEASSRIAAKWSRSSSCCSA